MPTDKDIQDRMTAAYASNGCACDGPERPDMSDPTMRQLFGDMFRGKQRWTSLLVMVFILALTFVMVVSVVMFFRTGEGETKGLILWATLFLTSGLFTGMLKMWFWMGMNRCMLVREVRRSEARLAAMQAGQSGSRPGGGIYT